MNFNRLKQQLLNITQEILRTGQQTDVQLQKKQLEKLTARVVRLERQVELLQQKNLMPHFRAAMRQHLALQRRFVATVLLGDLSAAERRRLVTESNDAEFEAREIRETIELIGQKLLEKGEISQLDLDIFHCYYGLDDGALKTFKEVADIFELSERRVNAVIIRVLKKFRHPMQSKRLVEFVSFRR